MVSAELNARPSYRFNVSDSVSSHEGSTKTRFEFAIDSALEFIEPERYFVERRTPKLISKQGDLTGKVADLPCGNTALLKGSVRMLGDVS